MSSQRARGALAVSVLVFFVIAYQHGSLPARSGDGPEQAREAIRAGALAGQGAGGAGGGAELGVKPDVRAAGDVRPGRGARAALGGGAELGAEPGVRAAGVARWGRGARAALGGGGGGMRRSTGAQRRAQNKEALAALSQRMCGSPAADMYAHVDFGCLRRSPTARWWRGAADAGRLGTLVPWVEEAADYDGIAVVWGLGHKAASAAACAQACLDHAPGPTPANGSAEDARDLPCNTFTWCGERTCFEPDIHSHTLHDCRLKFSEAPIAPEVNMRGELPKEFRARHSDAPDTVQWTAGVLLLAPLRPTNGTWGPRYSW